LMLEDIQCFNGKWTGWTSGQVVCQRVP
jgi:hypothetical protein